MRFYSSREKRKIIKKLTEPMQIAADKLDYEKAAKLRDQIRSVREIQEKQYAGGKVNDVDIVVCAKNIIRLVFNYLFIRSGLKSWQPKILSTFISKDNLNQI